jgi:hypothetical protein
MRWIYVLILILHYTINGVSAQEKKEKEIDFPQLYSVVFKTNPLAMIQGPFPVSNELKISSEIIVAPNQSTEIGFSLLRKGILFGVFTGQINQPTTVPWIAGGYRFQMSHRIYLNQKAKLGLLDYATYAPEGFFIGPLFSHATFTLTDQFNNSIGKYLKLTHTNFNLIGGYQFVFFDNYTFEAFTGFGYKKNVWQEHSPTNVKNIPAGANAINRSPLKIILGWNVGIAF